MTTNHSSQRLKVLTLVGTRPELIKLSRVIDLLDRFTSHIFVHTGQNYAQQLSGVFFDELRIRKPDHILSVADSTPMKSVAQIIDQCDTVFGSTNPDAVLVLGDTNSSLAVIAAKRRHIPIFHLEAGNRAFDDRTPEEVNRRIVDHTSDVNICYSQHAKQNLIREGLPTDRIFCVGSPMKEIFDYYAADIDRSRILSELQLESKKFLVVSLHREENVDSSEMLQRTVSSIDDLARKFKLPLIFSTHPRTRARLTGISNSSHTAIRFIDSLGFFDYVKLQRSAFCVVSDSGTLTEEASLLGFPAVTLRESHERPEGTDVGTLVMTNSSPASLEVSVEMAVAHFESSSNPKPVADYLVADFSWRVLKIIQGYTQFVNQRVWYR